MSRKPGRVAAWSLISVATTGYLYLTALTGYYAAIFYPVLALCVAACFMVLPRVLKQFNSPLALVFFILALLPGIVASGRSEYAEEKLLGLAIAVILMILPAATSDPPLAIRFILSFGAIACLGVVFRILIEGNRLANSTVALSTLNSIHAGRAAGLAFVIFSLILARMLTNGSKWWPPIAASVLVALWGLLSIGSRGPALAALSALLAAVAAILFRTGRVRYASIATAGTVLLGFSSSVGGETSRVFSTADTGRGRIYQVATEALSVNPLGLGWGNYQHLPGSAPHLWPHNIFLEIGIEGGWISLITLLALFLLAFRRVLRSFTSDDTVTPSYVLAFLVYSLVTAQFSADITGNAIVWSSLGMAFALPARPRSEDPLSEPPLRNPRKSPLRP